MSNQLFCLKCKSKTENIDEKVEASASGKLMLKSKCKVCGTKKSVFTKGAKEPKQEELKFVKNEPKQAPQEVVFKNDPVALVSPSVLVENQPQKPKRQRKAPVKSNQGFDLTSLIKPKRQRKPKKEEIINVPENLPSVLPTKQLDF
jgi:hypothetical protein